MNADSNSSAFAGNRLCLDFANLAFAPGDPTERAVSWNEFVDFLTVKQIVSEERSRHIRALAETDPRAAQSLLGHAERLGFSLRQILRGRLRSQRLQPQWAEPINRIMRVTEGHDELQWNGESWRLGFVAREEGLEWLLAAIARSGAELIAEGTSQNLKQCANPQCQIFFYDDSRTRRRRWCSMALCGNRHKVAAFARRNQRNKTEERARAHHA
jgi:predicted RNA-binding Zn ribbon-like protein